ncbi:MAG: PQQ-dependent sugar dehydrogenase [Rhizobacter sp.]|nr:PQQ-dependent sugar dehydrogenase [Rhizobacter sp.]
MNTGSIFLRTARSAFACSVAASVLIACGGGDDPVTPPSGNQAPVITLASPAADATYRAGDDIAIAATATDREDGALAANRLTWWVDLHHDTHSHPAQPVTNGGGGTFATPTRTEVSANVFYRVHVRAVDSGGRATEVTRDVRPQTAEITLATQPPGLQLTLDGQPVTAPHTVTGVQGVERDLGAATQVANGRRYTFAGWSDGGGATHTIGTPTANTTYTATFTDDGPANNTPPTVSLAAAGSGVVGTPVALSAAAADADGSVARVQFFDGSTLLGEDTSAPFEWAWTPTTAGAHALTARATDNAGDSSTSATVTVTVIDNTGPDGAPPTVTLTSPAHLAASVSGTVTVSATAVDNVGVAAVEFQVDGVALGVDDTLAPYSASWDASAYPPGQHIVRARARDAAGNVSPWSSATVQVASSASVPQGFTRQDNWIGGLDNATAFAQAADGRFFIAEQGGRIRIANAQGQFQLLPIINLAVDSSGERGLIGIALPPGFPSPNYLYVHYTRPDGRRNRVARFPYNDLLLGSEDRLLDLPELSNATNHNGGAIHFGADGKLYIGVGDNADSSHSPDLSTPFGKLLRINPDGSIPNDNPYFDTQRGAARAIWASGLRNPFTFAVEPGTGRIFINDVGAGAWEEINLGAPGADYGWPATEGPTNAAGVTAPLFAYRHDAASPPGSGTGGFFLGQSIAGGSFYPAAGGSFPAAYRRNYFFSDYVANTVGRLDPANGNAAYAFATLNGNPVDMLVGQDGALYVLTRSGVTRIAPAP